VPRGDTPAAPIAASVTHAAAGGDWTDSLIAEVERRLHDGVPDVMDTLARDFEAAVIRTALKHTHGRRIDAATRLGVGRNTITRKIQELQLED
jgi:two-component system, NtrC family, nitrogen regulation response regulator GlnG